MLTIAIANQKGGVGKTATCHNLAYALHGLGYSVVAVDLDPQASLTKAWDSEPDVYHVSVVDCLLTGASLISCVRESDLPYPCLIASESRLAAAEEWLTQRVGREGYLRRYVIKPLGDAYDYCLVDCPPNKGTLTVNALAAAQLAIVPTQPSKADIDGTSLFLSETVREVREFVNPDLAAAPVLVTQYDGRRLEDAEIVAALDAQGVPRWRSIIPATVRVREATRMHLPVMAYAPTNPAAVAYTELAKEIAAWLASQ